MVGDDPDLGHSDCRHREETMPPIRKTPDNRDFQIEDPKIHDDRQYAGELHHLEILHPTLINLSPRASFHQLFRRPLKENMTFEPADCTPSTWHTLQ